VVSPDPLEADVLATALYVMGPEVGEAFSRDLVDTGVLFLIAGEHGVEVRWNQAMESRLANPERLRATTTSKTRKPEDGS
jgi:thiamine biosynthesis lipoprotein ApbE